VVINGKVLCADGDPRSIGPQHGPGGQPTPDSCPCPALVQAIMSHSYTDDVVEWLHETAQQQLHPLDSSSCCSSTGCIGHIWLFCAADTNQLLYTLLCLCHVYSVLLLFITDQWAISLPQGSKL